MITTNQRPIIRIYCFIIYLYKMFQTTSKYNNKPERIRPNREKRYVLLHNSISLTIIDHLEGRFSFRLKQKQLSFFGKNRRSESEVTLFHHVIQQKHSTMVKYDKNRQNPQKGLRMVFYRML